MAEAEETTPERAGAEGRGRRGGGHLVERPPGRAPRLVSRLTELPMLVVFALVIAVVIKSYLLQAFYIPSESMVPALLPGDRVLVEKISYRLHEPRREDVVVFARSVFGKPPDVPWWDDVRNYLRELLGLPVGAETDYIKRIVAVGGDTLRYVGRPRRLIVNGDVVAEPYVNGGEDRGSGTITSRSCKHLEMDAVERGCRVPAGEVFVMGDNRSGSEDSRVIGPVDEDKIVGRAFLVLWPFDRLGGL